MKEGLLDSYKLEACVETLEEGLFAMQAGADQLELCADLELDGLTPSLSLVDQFLNKIPLPLKVMLRCRGGDFVYSKSEKEEMLALAKVLSSKPIRGVVCGALLKGGQIDLNFIEELGRHLGGMPICFHKAIDESKDIIKSCRQLESLECVDSILSSGGAESAKKGLDILKSMRSTINRIELIAAGKITYENIETIHQHLNLRTYHGRKIVHYHK